MNGRPVLLGRRPASSPTATADGRVTSRSLVAATGPARSPSGSAGVTSWPGSAATARTSPATGRRWRSPDRTCRSRPCWRPAAPWAAHTPSRSAASGCSSRPSTPPGGAGFFPRCCVGWTRCGGCQCPVRAVRGAVPVVRLAGGTGGPVGAGGPAGGLRLGGSWPGPPLRAVGNASSPLRGRRGVPLWGAGGRANGKGSGGAGGARAPGFLTGPAGLGRISVRARLVYVLGPLAPGAGRDRLPVRDPRPLPRRRGRGSPVRRAPALLRAAHRAHSPGLLRIRGPRPGGRPARVARRTREILGPAAG